MLKPSCEPSMSPSMTPSSKSSMLPSNTPSMIPSSEPSMLPSNTPSNKPSNKPSNTPSACEEPQDRRLTVSWKKVGDGWGTEINPGNPSGLYDSISFEGLGTLEKCQRICDLTDGYEGTAEGSPFKLEVL